MKTVTKDIQVTNHITQYEAADGTVFTTQEECQKYEESAAAMLLAKLKDCEITRAMDTQWFDCSDDNEYRTLLPTTIDQIDAMNQLWFMHGGCNQEEAKFTEKDLDTLVLMGVRYCNSQLEWCWFYKFDYIMQQMTNDKYTIVKKP